MFFWNCETSSMSKTKPVNKSTKTLLKQPAILSVTHFTDNQDPTEQRIPQDDNPLHLDLSYCISEYYSIYFWKL